MLSKIAASVGILFLAVGCSAPDAIETAIQSSGWEAEDTSHCLPEANEDKVIPNVCKGNFTYSSEDFSKDEIAAITAAAEEINSFFAQDLVKVSEGKSTECQIATEALEGKKLGTYRRRAGIGNIFLDTAKLAGQASLLRNVASHELLHSLGMVHSQGGLMCSTAGHSLNGIDFDQAQKLGLVP